MKIQIAALFLVALTTSHSVATGVPVNPVRHLQVHELASLVQELAEWKTSTAAQDAQALGISEISTNEWHEHESVSEEEDELARFYQTKQRIEELKQQHPHAEFSTDTPFTLLTDEEFASFVQRSGLQNEARLAEEHAAMTGSSFHEIIHDDELPVAVDWSQSGCLTPVKNQGKCGSCAYFAATAAIEVAQCMYQNNGRQTIYSEQRSVSCFGGACGGEWPRRIFQFMKEDGLCRSEEYPYTSGASKVAGECKLNSCTAEMPRIQDVVRVNTTEKSLMAAMVNRPVVVMVAAGNPAWKQYKRGVIETCGDAQMDHAVLATSYAHEATDGKYWHLKNSWGTSWGDAGFVRLRRGVAHPHGTCRILHIPPVYANYH